jgi:hypothetical protein
MASQTHLSPTEAERAIYIDFEGTAVDPPSLLGAEWLDADDLHFIQYVLEEGLWPAAQAKAKAPGRFCEPASWDDLTEVRRVAESDDRRVIAWSIHERDQLASCLSDADDQAWFAEHVLNAIPLAKRWKRRFHADVVFKVDPKLRRGRHQLHRYFELIGYTVPTAFGPGNSAQRIRYVREMLDNKGSDYSALTSTAKAKWTKALEHNWHDCNGLRELMIRCAHDLS